MERIVALQLIDYIILNSIVNYFQSAYLHNRSPETAIDIVFNDIILSMDNKSSCHLAHLDLYSTYDSYIIVFISSSYNRYSWTSSQLIDIFYFQYNIFGKE